jgi:hypothetical protein
MVDHAVVSEKTLKIDSENWTWIDIPLNAGTDFFSPELDLTLEEGSVDFDMCLLAAGPWTSVGVAETLELPAPCFFHAGYTDLDNDRIILLKAREPDRVILYGPLMPLDPGLYEAELVFHSDAEQGFRLGEFNATDCNTQLGTIIVTPDKRATLGFRQETNLLLRLEFRYARKADIEIEKVVLRRIE